MNVAIFLPNWLGDLVMATPALRALRRHFPPPCRIVGIVRPHLAEALAGTCWVDELWGFQAKSSTPSPPPLGLDPADAAAAVRPSRLVHQFPAHRRAGLAGRGANGSATAATAADYC